MMQYVARRLLIAVPTLWLITVITFLIINLSPGDPLVGLILSSEGAVPAQMSPEYVQSLRVKYNLDRPLAERYVLWLKQILRGNLGMRFGEQQSVTEAIGNRLPYTLELMTTSLLIAVLIGIPLGIISGLKQYSRVDYSLTVVALAGISIPEFLVGIFLIYGVAVKLHWLPTGGILTPGASFTWGDNLRHLILPATALCLAYVSTFMRYARSSVLEVLHQEYVTTARAKGLRERVVISVHVFRNALLPLITVIGLTLPRLLAGSVIVETIFNWPGMGLLYIQAERARDYTTIMALILISAVMVLLANLITDVVYAIVDPRIKYG